MNNKIKTPSQKLIYTLVAIYYLSASFAIAGLFNLLDTLIPIEISQFLVKYLPVFLLVFIILQLIIILGNHFKKNAK